MALPISTGAFLGSVFGPIGSVIGSSLDESLKAFEQDKKQFIKNYIPELETHFDRYQQLCQSDDICIAAVGDFNHGKSSLLNALINQKDFFKTSDQRETTENQTYTDEENKIIWLDTPGLNADPSGSDDKKANQGAFIYSDILLFVHNLSTGELDNAEKEYLEDVVKNTPTVKKVLVLTKLDKFSQSQQQEEVINKIQEQIQGMPLDLFTVSADRYWKATEKNQPKFVELSQINELKQYLVEYANQLISERPQLRADLKVDLKEKLNHILLTVEEEIQQEKAKFNFNRQEFLTQLNKHLKAFN
ncbi:GTPase [Caviibacterium pharyngocola]|uniref:G domain-containing protein n=1 Tax=Caviibacterium pharyngocola TaxID=28159 RepID=A0A2M8RWT0_9PAST|nr:GTPase [Caviibacterium pharyngocola]PJG83345.1 hypothetical protein CVP04_04270 [Caviibacterium pharyngocola]